MKTLELFDTTPEQALKAINSERLQNKNQWVYAIGSIRGITIKVKFFDTSIQILQTGNLKYSPPMDASVKVFKSTILESLSF